MIQPIEADLAREAIEAARKLVGDIDRLASKLAASLPIDATRFAQLGEDEGYRILAFLKRFEELQDLSQRKLFRLVILAAGEDPRDYTAADLVARLDTLGLIDAAEWNDATGVRNILVHDYPMNVAQEADRTNAAWASIGVLQDGARAAIGYLNMKGISG